MAAESITLTPIHHVVLHIINSLFPRTPGAIELMKLVYLADVEALRLTGHTLTGCEYVRKEKGPYCYAVRDAIEEMDGHEICVTIAPTRTDYPKHEHCPGDDPRFTPEHGPMAEVIINSVLARVRGLAPRQLEKLAYDTEPMKQMTDAEARLDGALLLDQPVDLSLVEPDPLMARWRENRRRYLASPDPEREKELEQEGHEWCQVLEAL